MSVGRRDFIIGSVTAAASSALLSGCDSSESNGGADGGVPLGPDAGGGAAAARLDELTFAHGVASGDPLGDRVILWTRASGPTGAPAELAWIVASDPSLRVPVQEGRAGVSAERDYTVKVDVTGLSAGTTYYYAFYVPGGGRSAIGRTRTLPANIERARIAFTSCANYQNGYFNAYRAIANRSDLDLWIHLGDYIYEYPAGTYADAALAGTRSHLPVGETVQLADYRARYAQYRTDRDLQEVHRQHPLVAVWDDHEFANNANLVDAENHDAVLEGAWDARKRVAAQAFLEWLPIREQAPNAGPVPNIYRTFSFGDLFDLIMLDTRMIARAKQAGWDASLGMDVGSAEVWQDPTRQLLGTEQEAWFLRELTRSRERSAGWRLIGNQVIFAQTRSPDPRTPMNILFSDFWDGYQPARKRVIDHVVDNGIQNVVFLTGDIHSSWAMEIGPDPFALAPKPPFAIELVGPSVTSLAYEEQPNAAFLVGALRQANPHVVYSEVTQKGYVLVDLTRERLQAEWYYVNHKLPNAPAETLGHAASCMKDAARFVAGPAPTAPKEAPLPAPAG